MIAGQAAASLFNASEYLLDRQIQAGRGDHLALTGTAGDISYGELAAQVGDLRQLDGKPPPKK